MIFTCLISCLIRFKILNFQYKILYFDIKILYSYKRNKARYSAKCAEYRALCYGGAQGIRTPLTLLFIGACCDLWLILWLISCIYHQFMGFSLLFKQSAIYVFIDFDSCLDFRFLRLRRFGLWIAVVAFILDDSRIINVAFIEVNVAIYALYPAGA